MSGCRRSDELRSSGEGSYSQLRGVSRSWLLLLIAAGCGGEPQRVLEITVRLRGEPAPISTLYLTAVAGDRTAAATVSAKEGGLLGWPTSVRLDVTALPSGPATLSVTALDVGRTTLAAATVPLRLPTSGPVEVELRCVMLACGRPPADGGVGPPPEGSLDGAADAAPDGRLDASGDRRPDEQSDGLMRDGSAGDRADAPGGSSETCGNRQLDPGEACDIGIRLGPGACPESCDDGIPCTADERRGADCQITCHHRELTATASGDGCCPAHADHGSDEDCSASCGNSRVDPGETCDTAIREGDGACPIAATCNDGDSCTNDRLISASTCSARCTHEPVLSSPVSDGCCPADTSAASDPDCPSVCGNQVLDPGETCDVEIGVGAGACPRPQDCDDHDPCTQDVIEGNGCEARCAHRIIDTARAGDGCCPAPGWGPNADPDCPPICGNGVVEAGETCDRDLAGQAPGACLEACPAPPAACVRYELRGSSTACSSTCVPVAVAECFDAPDGCCPMGCTRATDPDCSETCGNGLLEPDETCDTAITAATGAGACPQTCTDGIACTTDLLVDAATCSARCAFVPTTSFRTGDGCCPNGANAALDGDCAPACGNGVVEPPWESCDPGVASVACAPRCAEPETCATFVAGEGSPCGLTCARRAIAACSGATEDGCCPEGCDALTDADCRPRCGNGVVEPGETCDRRLTAGTPGSCLATCADGNACTRDVTRGSVESCTRACSHIAITACAAKDGCCPPGCSAENDADCAAVCGDGVIQAGETCDPPSACPTSCADDGDPCTRSQLAGSADRCNVTCTHVPITSCSGTTRDGCCPTSCTPSSDNDC